jgi:hypothetical protein
VSSGPFDVDPTEIANLKTSFVPFMRQLMLAERVKVRLTGDALRLAQNENEPDGGIDAAVSNTATSNWFPAGNSVWQFKRANVNPAALAKELRDAPAVQQALRDGESYRVVIGVGLTEQTIRSRTKALVEAAKDLKIDIADEQIKVIDANQICDWIDELPSVATSTHLTGSRKAMISIEAWGAARELAETYVSCDSRGTTKTSIELVAAGTQPDLRIEGEQGVGKTRLALEVLKDNDAAPLVAYVPAGDLVDADLRAFISQPGKDLILVVDNCDSALHKQLADGLSADSAVRIITIGEADATTFSSRPVAGVGEARDDELSDILNSNTNLSPEARRVVAENSFGNVRLAIALARELSAKEASEAAELLRLGDAKAFVRALIPSQADYFLASVIALLERIGWTSDKRHELELLAEFVERPVSDFDKVEQCLRDAGLVSTFGRFRAVTPHPVAVFLAADAWERLGSSIVTDLLPRLPTELQLSLLRRAAALGRFEPVQAVLADMIAPDGPFGSLETIEADSSAAFLTQLAVVMPERTMRLLESLLRDKSFDELRQYKSSRRDLVWTLEKLAWHSATFEAAADLLLQLAQAENETWANNATGTWLSLFGVLLPATAASPTQRLAYLRACAQSPSEVVRHLVVKAARNAAHPHESVSVSAEVQGGAIVEPRGGVTTWADAASHRLELIRLLDQLRKDPAPGIASAATEALLSAMHPLIDQPEVGKELLKIYRSFEGDALDSLRKEMAGLRRLFKDHDNAVIREILDELERALPAPSPLEELRALLDTHPWTFNEEGSNSFTELVRLLDEVIKRDELGVLLRWILTEDLAAAVYLGEALAKRFSNLDTVLPLLVETETALFVLIGILSDRANSNPAIFEDFLNSELGRNLPPASRVRIMVRAPNTTSVAAMIHADLVKLSVVDGIQASFGWQAQAIDVDREIVLSWVERVETQRDYNALVDWLMLRFFREPIPDSFDSIIDDLLVRRIEFPQLANERFDWSNLAIKRAPVRPLEISRLILDLIEQGELFSDFDDESKALTEAAKASPIEVWDEVAARLGGNRWRVAMTTRGWLTYAFPIEVIEAWVGDDLGRARLVASIAAVGGSEPSDVARFLLDRFGDDDQVGGSLSAEFGSGTWVGPWSGHIESQIKQLESWSSDASAGVRRWAARMIEGLRLQKQDALQREAERGY